MASVSAITDSFKSPLTQTFRVSEVLPLSVDNFLSYLGGSSNLFWHGKSVQEQTFVQEIKERSQRLWFAAARLNPKFQDVPLDIEVLFGQNSINAFTTGYGKVRITKDLIRAVLAEKELTHEQKLDVMSSIIAHEMGHCLQRHICRDVCKKLLFTTIDLLSQYCYPLAVIADLIIEVWALATFNYFSRLAEQEADITGVLILDSYNQTNDNTIDLDIVPLIWTRFKPFVSSPPRLFQLFSTHPSSQERARLTTKMAWILKHNRDVLTNKTKRRAFFKETRPVTDRNFRVQWRLPRSELSGVIARGDIPPAITPAMHIGLPAWITA